MKSIRLALLLYFSGLLVAALGTASVLAYRTADAALLTRRKATEQQIEARFQFRCRAEEIRVDEALRAQAITLSKLVQIRPNYQNLNFVGLIGSGLAAESPLLTYGWLLYSPWYPSVSRQLQTFPFEIHLAEEDSSPNHVETPLADFFQIDTPLAKSYLSPALGTDFFPVDPGFLNYEQTPPLIHEDISLDSGRPVRRVVIRSRIFNIFTLGGSLAQPARTAGNAREPNRVTGTPTNPVPNNLTSPGRVSPFAAFRPTMIIHCGYELDHLERSYREMETDRDDELQQEWEKTEFDRASIRNRLWLISSLTFLAAMCGTAILVRLGLAPLQRLSEAVSRVSPRDFRLPLVHRRLPLELQPIVGRLKDTLATLKRTFAREKQATADISHELRTPLAVLLTTTDLALRKPRTADQYREMLLDCRQSAQQMNEVVQRLLTLARLDAGTDILNTRPVNVTELAEECTRMVRPLAEARAIHLALQPSPKLVIEADVDKFREILNNLLHNAIQYNKPAGRIDVRLVQDNGQVRLDVGDTGIGIAEEAREQIFERFYRADPSRGGDGLHAGLGLALVKEYVGLMGGRIAVDSVVGQGSTFHVWLPA